MRFLIDMPLSPALAQWLREQGHDAAHASELHLDRAPDTAILDRARAEGRVVVTADLDFPRLLAVSRADGPGLILFRGGHYGEREATDRLAVALDRVPEHTLARSIVVIEKRRIRRRDLPVEPDP